MTQAKLFVCHASNLVLFTHQINTVHWYWTKVIFLKSKSVLIDFLPKTLWLFGRSKLKFKVLMIWTPLISSTTIHSHNYTKLLTVFQTHWRLFHNSVVCRCSSVYLQYPSLPPFTKNFLFLLSKLRWSIFIFDSFSKPFHPAPYCTLGYTTF